MRRTYAPTIRIWRTVCLSQRKGDGAKLLLDSLLLKDIRGAMTDVFVSYASEDRARIAPLVEALEAEGWSVWWDQHMHAGPNFRTLIENALRDCRCVIVAWSRHSVASDFVIDEATVGKDRNILVPFQLDTTEVPLGFRTMQIAQLQNWPDQDGQLAGLLQGVASTLGDETAAPPPPQPAAAASISRRIWLAAAAAVVLGSVVLMGHWQAPQPDTPGETSIAVLPLDNTADDAEAEFLVRGVQEALIATLSKLSGVRVTSPSSARRVDRDMGAGAIAERLDVEHLIEGSVQREGNQIRVTIRLIDPSTETSRWSQSYDRQMDSMLALQAEIARAIASEIHPALSPADERGIATLAQQRPDSYEAYLRGMHELRKETLRGYRSGIRIMREALAQDPDSALVHAGVAIGYSMLGHNFYPETALPKAREAALKALSLDDELPEVHLAMGMYKMYFEWHWEDAETYLLRALELNPSLVDAHYHYAWLLDLLGRKDEALLHGEQTRAINPLSPFYNGWLADQYRSIGRYDDAISQARYTISLNESYPLGWYALGNAYADAGDYDAALTAHEELRDRYFWSWALGGTLAKAGRIDEARALAAAIEAKADNAIPLALISAAVGDRESMYHWLNVAREERMSWYPWLVGWFPLITPYRQDPEMIELRRALSLLEDDIPTAEQAHTT